MKNIIKLLSLVLICTFAFSVNNADAQTRKKKSDKVDEYFDDQGTLFQRLWYGADLNFGFVPLQDGNVISYGLSPMAGLKINEWLSIGPRIEFSNLNIKLNDNFGGGILNKTRFNAVTAGAGVFVRARIGPTYYAHIEFDKISTVSLTDIEFDTSTGELIKNRTSVNHLYLGGGYTRQLSDTWGFQISLLFDALVDRDLWTLALPIDTRFGVTYKFEY